MNQKKRLKNIASKAIPLWMVFMIVIYSVLATGLVEYYIMKRNFNSTVAELSKTTKNPDELIQALKQQVLPQQGYTLAVEWSDIGKLLMESGVIDKTKYNQLFADDSYSKNQMKYLTMSSNDHMMINEQNSHFMVNTLWALGLVNKNKILDEGPMKTTSGNAMNFASTGGWTLGSKPTSELYSSTGIFKLTSEQQELVKKIAGNIYRPCCGNSTEFPDCNHGMAALGYIEAAVKQGVSEDRIYKDILALNSFWFPQQYVELAAYLNKQVTDWGKVDVKLALSSQYSSAQGSQQVHQYVASNIAGFTAQGGSCGT